ncbi:MAG: hypothetical protein BKP49_09480 [Treponema sp. CETP13]|nr:MAG: hypothetical protein BKP49_09480 [Treponema sp. CETP13]
MARAFSFADTERVKRFILTFLIILISLPGFSWAIKYKEEYYNLYHIHYQQYPSDVIENIYWLERSIAADFCNPQFALAHIDNKDEWEKYRYLFMMHVNLKLAEQHLRLGRTWDKNVAYFYDAPWKDEYLRNLNTAESCYQAGLYYWTEAKTWAQKANQDKFNFLYLTDIQNWEDECFRIDSGDLDYEKTINRELSRLSTVQDDLNKMDSNY